MHYPQLPVRVLRLLTEVKGSATSQTAAASNQIPWASTACAGPRPYSALDGLLGITTLTVSARSAHDREGTFDGKHREMRSANR